MPWTGMQFRERHNHGMSPAIAPHAASIANATLRSGVPEGESIAIANKWAMKHRDSGGIVDPTSGSIGGVTPSPQTMNPMMRGLVQRYSSMPVEKLQEMNAMMGGSPYGSLIRAVLNQKLAMPTTDQGMQPQPQPQANGGRTRLAMGGNPMGMSLSMAEPPWVRQEARSADEPASGFLNGASAGRADAIKTTAPSGAYVLPADVVAGLGEGNSLAGARVVDAMLSTGPHGIDMPRGVRGRGVPRPPSMNEPRMMEAKGGGVQDKGGDTTPVALSHGEYVVTPEQVMALGGGDLRRGHRILDSFVLKVRKLHIEKLKTLPAPVGAKKKAA